MSCWFCHWGWPKPIADIYLRAVEKLGGHETPLHYGPAHIVWQDENFESAHTQWCMDHFFENAAGYEYDQDTLRIIWQSLFDLHQLPEELKCAPDGYDDDDNSPEKFPPPVGVEMVKV